MGERSFFVEPGTILGSRAEIRGQVARQIQSVLRLRPGDEIELLDNSGSAFAARIAGVGRDSVEAEITGMHEPRTEPGVRIELFQALLKGQKTEMVLQKGTEIGVSLFVLMLSDRCVSRPSPRDPASRLERWRTIVREAAEQSGRAVLPEVVGLTPFPQACEEAATSNLALMAWEGARSGGLAEAVRARGLAASPGPVADRPKLSLLVGPEGGFSAREAERAADAGIRIVSLGPRVLRAETAAIVACALALGSTGDLGGS